MGREYIPVSINNIPVGLELDCKVYAEKHGEYSFLCENTTVTESLLDRFRNAAYPYESVYIAANYLEAFLSKGVNLGWTEEEIAAEKNKKLAPAPEPAAPEPVTPAPEPAPKPPPKKKTVPPPPPPEYFEIKKHYEESKTKAKNILNTVAETKKVDIKEADDLIHQMGRKLETGDISLIMQSINGLRNVDEYLHTHSLNVAYLNGLMAKWLNYDKKKHDEIVKAGLLHDVGKLLVPPEILNKPGKLTNEEFNTVKKHAIYSFEVLVNSGIRDKDLLLGVMQHHEKLNGTGYPNNLPDKEISEFARITSISDIYDAMVAKRVYKDAQSPFVILANFAEEAYSMLDIKLVKLFIDNMIYVLKGKYVIMSDGSVAKVAMINERKIIYPLVEIDGEIIPTTPEFYCVSMYDSKFSNEIIEDIL